MNRRWIKIESKNWTQEFLYDRYGNKNFEETNTTTLTKSCGSSPNFTVCPNDRKHENPEIEATNNRMKELQPDGDQITDYEYDAAGNTIKDPSNRRFKYDGENKQIKVVQLDSNGNETSTIGEYFFDGDGKRVRKVVPATGETTIFHYDAGGKLIVEYSSVVEPVSTAQTSYLTNDHLGSPRITTDQFGNVSSRRDFLPFGEELISLHTQQRSASISYNSDTIRQKFTGYERDGESTLDFAQARMCNYMLGRFQTADPLLSTGRLEIGQSWNRYTFVLNNPVRFTDTSGLYEYDSNAKAKQRERFEKQLAKAGERLSKIKDRYGEGSKEYTNASRALNAYGEKGKANGVKVAFGTTKTGRLGETSGLISGSTEFTKAITVTIDLDSVKDNGDLETLIAHEGSHVADRSAFVDAWIPTIGTDNEIGVLDGALNLTSDQTEVKAYGVSSVLAEFALKNELPPPTKPGEIVLSNKNYHSQTLSVGGVQVWNPAWKSAEASVVQANRSAAIRSGLDSDPVYSKKANQKFTD